jgi:hypothetical protein
MNNQVKSNKMPVGFYVSAAGALLAVVSLIFCVLNEIEKNDISLNILAPTVVAILVEVAVIIGTKVKGYKQWFANANVLNSILIALSFIMYISTRTSYIQGLFVALEVLTPAFLGTMICFALTLVITIASSFMKQMEE